MSKIGRRCRRLFRRATKTVRGRGPGAVRIMAGDPEYCEYARYLYSPRRMIMSNFAAGLARGVGMAVGFSLLGAVLVYMLQRIAWQNIPGLSTFIAEIIRTVQAKS